MERYMAPLIALMLCSSLGSFAVAVESPAVAEAVFYVR